MQPARTHPKNQALCPDREGCNNRAVCIHFHPFVDCREFSKGGGQCPRGVSCRYKHDASAVKPKSPNTGTGAGDPLKLVCTLREGCPNKTTTCQLFHPNKACSFYKGKDSCRNGGRCRFMHVDSAPARRDVNANKVQPPNPQQQPAVQRATTPGPRPHTPQPQQSHVPQRVATPAPQPRTRLPQQSPQPNPAQRPVPKPPAFSPQQVPQPPPFPHLAGPPLFRPPFYHSPCPPPPFHPDPTIRPPQPPPPSSAGRPPLCPYRENCPTKPPRGPCQFFHPTKQCRYSEVNATGITNIPRQYAQTGTCTMHERNECNYMHDPRQVNLTTPPPQQKAPAERKISDVKPDIAGYAYKTEEMNDLFKKLLTALVDDKEKKKAPGKVKCREWKKNGGTCDRKSSCIKNFLHPTIRCTKQPNCTRGDKCFYIHDDDGVEAKEQTPKTRSALTPSTDEAEKIPEDPNIVRKNDELKATLYEFHKMFACVECHEVKECNQCQGCAKFFCDACIRAESRRSCPGYRPGGKFGYGSVRCTCRIMTWNLSGDSAQGIVVIQQATAIRAQLLGQGVLPAFCDQPLCLCFDLPDGNVLETQMTPDVLSLLLFAFFRANESNRRSAILNPSPDGVIDIAKLSGDMNRTQLDVVSVYKELEKSIQCPRKILESSEKFAGFKKEKKEQARFLEWLVCSNRSYLVRVPEAKRVDTRFMQTDKQYLFVSDTPEKQREFEMLARQAGHTRFLFHGSRIENWHSIIRNGLKNMSGTCHQQNGNAHGNGIYLSPYLNASLWYSGSGGTNCRPACSRNGCCLYTNPSENQLIVALVEVVDTPEAYTSQSEGVSVVRLEKYCSIRMILLYPSSLLSSDSGIGSFSPGQLCNLHYISQATRDQIAKVVALHKP